MCTRKIYTYDMEASRDPSNLIYQPSKEHDEVRTEDIGWQKQIIFHISKYRVDVDAK